MKKILLILAAVMLTISASAQGFGGGNGPGGMPPQGMGQGGPGGRPGDMKGMPPGGKPGKEKKQKKENPLDKVYVTVPTMYAYAVGVLDGDSVVYTSDILELNGAQIVKSNGFLVNRQDYSSQFKTYLSTNMGLPNRTCAVVFNKSRGALTNDFNKLKKLYAKKKQLVQVIDKSQFQFIVTNN